MRRPRGPGGRFLTADEIAAQKTAEAGPSNETEPESAFDIEYPPPVQPAFPPTPITLSSPYAAMHHVPHPHAHARHHHAGYAEMLYNAPFSGDN